MCVRAHAIALTSGGGLTGLDHGFEQVIGSNPLMGTSPGEYPAIYLRLCRETSQRRVHGISRGALSDLEYQKYIYGLLLSKEKHQNCVRLGNCKERFVSKVGNAQALRQFLIDKMVYVQLDSSQSGLLPHERRWR